jgi:hypothetical protein
VSRETKFWVRFNGDDARIEVNTDDYEEACREARRRSENMDWGAWLGYAVFGPSGLIAVYKDGELSGYLSGDGNWVEVSES